MKSSLSRLTALEHSCLQDPLIVLAEDDNGNAEKMSVQEMLSSGRGFAKVVRGSRLSDLDKLLLVFRDRALQATQNNATDNISKEF